MEIEVKTEPEPEPEPERLPSTPEKLPSPSTPVSDIKENVSNDAEKTPVSNLEAITGLVDDEDKTTIKTGRRGRRKARIVYSSDKAALMDAKDPAAQGEEEEEDEDDDADDFEEEDDEEEEEGEEEEEQKKAQTIKPSKESPIKDPKDALQAHSSQSPKTSSDNATESDKSSKPSRGHAKRIRENVEPGIAACANSSKRSRLSVASPVTTEDHSSTKPVNRSKAQLLTKVPAIAIALSFSLRKAFFPFRHPV